MHNRVSGGLCRVDGGQRRRGAIHLKTSCKAEDSTWLFSMQRALAEHFNITQQRIEVAACTDASTVQINVLETGAAGDKGSLVSQFKKQSLATIS
jgi:hypothetical protein